MNFRTPEVCTLLSFVKLVIVCPIDIVSCRICFVVFSNTLVFRLYVVLDICHVNCVILALTSSNLCRVGCVKFFVVALYYMS